MRDMATKSAEVMKWFTVFGLLCLGSYAWADSATTKSAKGEVSCKKQQCALYESTAKTKAAWSCGLRQFKGNCTCTKTANACGKNWRGKTKYTYACTCKTTSKQAKQAKNQPLSPASGQLCKRQLCSLYTLSAKTKSAWKCGLRKYKGNCYCKKLPMTCGRNWRGKTKHIHDCVCRAACKRTVCAVYSIAARGKSAWQCGWKKGYTTKRCKCTRTTTCGKNWRGKYKYNYECKCK